MISQHIAALATTIRMQSVSKDDAVSEMSEGIIYMSDHSSPNCWIGHLEDEDDIREEDIVSFIRTCKPALFEHLHGLPLKSSDVPLSFHGQRTLHRLRQISGGENKSGQKRVRDVPDVARQHHHITHEKHVQELHPDVQVIQGSRERIEHKLTSGFNLCKLPVPRYSEQRVCDFPLCQDPYLHETADSNYFAILYNLNISDQYHTPPDDGDERFCLSCFEGIFPRYAQKQASQARKETEAQLLLDGISDEEVLGAAGRLYPSLTPCKLELEHEHQREKDPRQNFSGVASNLSDATRVRAHKQYEIDDILVAVSKYEKAITSARSREGKTETPRPPSEPSVLISRPEYMEPPKERYKKQGLTRYARAKYTRELRKQQPQSSSSPEGSLLSSISPISTHFQHDRICSCRELNDFTEVIRCSSEKCPIGSFHLRCTGLERLPTKKEEFRCCYCSVDFKPSIILKPAKDTTCAESTDSSPVEDVFPLFVTDIDHETGTATLGCYDSKEQQGSVRSVKGEKLAATIQRWMAVNGPFQQHNVNTAAPPAEQPLSEWNSGENPEPGYSEGSNLPSSSRPRNSTEGIFDGSQHHLNAPQAVQDASIPSTPPLRPAYISSNPWGTPINIDSPSLEEHRVLVNSPQTPSHVAGRKRQLAMTELSKDDEK